MTAIQKRVALESIIFLGLIAAIIVAASGRLLVPSSGSVLAAGGILLAGFLVYAAYRASTARSRDADLLKGALWDLIRLMERNGKSGASAAASARRELLHHFAVDGAHKVAAGRPMPMGDTAALDLTRLAFELMDRNDKDGSAASRKVNSVRRGVFVFYAMAALDNPGIAYRAMIGHMHHQLRDGEAGGIDNFTEMKRLLGLPVSWPADQAALVALDERGLPRSRERAIRRLIHTDLSRAFSGVEYIPAGSDIGYSAPSAILAQMRDYIR